ncbi:MAG: LuxR C-terminal-related transcriptional regulator, partial [Treponema sp.]|nr:LuxR C-terminal-related transcriptional regulator [Treponema sp.]
DISLAPDSLRVIRQDTEGWAFALNYIIRSYKKAPGYEGYLRNAMKSNIFRFMETEVWNVMSESLQNFLVRLSLIDHLSIDLILLLAGEEADIADELEKQSAYVRRDNFINAFLIHPLFLEFLATKQDILSYEQKSKTYTIAGIWCNQNGFKIDALSYYEKIGDYKSIAYMFIDSPLHIQYDVACYAEAILDRAPQEAFDSVTFLASVHLRTIMCQGCFDKAGKKAAYYEKKYLNWKKNDTFKKMTMYSIYYCWALVRMAVCVSDEICDFDIYFEKLSNCIPEPSNSGNVIHRAPGPWFCALGSSKKGAVQDFIDAFVRSGEHLSKCSLDFRSGEDQLARGEFKFYQGDIQGAESFVANGLSRAREMKRSEIINRALFYALRIAVLQGNYNKAEKALQDMGAALDDPSYIYRFTEYDVSLCWYYCALGMPEKVPDWLKENFSLYAHAGFIENCANQMKARYCYQTRNYPPLLSYINEMKKRESYLFGRIEMLAIEACIHYKMKDKKNAYAAFKEAYDTALPNGIVMPFIELGKDMRTLTTCTLKNYKKIPTAWLEDINRKSASYAKRLTRIVTEYRQASGIADNIVISPRELEVLTDLSHGLSRTEIAVSRNLSINTVKMLVNNIYMKLGAENLVDAIRIAVERKII